MDQEPCTPVAVEASILATGVPTDSILKWDGFKSNEEWTNFIMGQELSALLWDVHSISCDD